MATEKDFIVGKGIVASDVIENKSGGFKFPDASVQLTAISKAANEVVTGNWQFAPTAGDVDFDIGGTTPAKAVTFNEGMFSFHAFNPVPDTAPDVFEIKWTGDNASASAPNGFISLDAPQVFLGTNADSHIYVNSDDAVTKSGANGVEITSVDGIVNFNGAILTDLADPTGPQDAVTVQYLSSLVGSPSGIAPLDVDGLIPSNYLPALAITETFVVDSEAQMVALVAERGDIAIRTDNSTTYILTTDDPTTAADWVALSVPAGGVTSVTVNGTAGRITSSGSPITSSGAITVDLATVTDANTGTFQKVTVDAYGRVSGTVDVALSDIQTLLTGQDVGVGSLNANGNIQDAFTSTSTSTSQKVLASISTTDFTVAKFLVSVVQSGNLHAVEVLVGYDGTNVFITEYGQILTGSELGVFDADVSGGNVRLLFTPANGTTMTFKVGSQHLGVAVGGGV